MTVSPGNSEQVKALFEQALVRTPEERTTFLLESTTDQNLRQEVLTLLADYDRTASLHFTPAHDDSGSTDSGRLAPGKLLDGKFKIIRLIAEGGVGQVWLAEQTVPLQRQVVVKLIKTGLFDDNLLQRFRAERQSLAIMDHPSIAKVFDAGATTAGQPYFVMEYVPGLAVTKYCDEKKLSIRDRLELFTKVCDGVQHAHQKAIIHRDLKPANILVVEVDEKPVPRIIDFGIAKALSPDAASSELTQVTGFIGTPGYMSPEQADPRIAQVDTRTDVYSLGVILYELLAGSLPFDRKEWQDKPLYEMLRRMREDDPPRPSTKVSTAAETATATAEARATDAKRLASLLRGDLDCITMKALEKDPARRYGTPSELAADLQRYMSNEPVLARPASTAYKLQKYVRRHRIGVAVAGGVATLLVAFVVLQTVQLRRTIRERDRANRITAFMTGMFMVSDPSEARGNSITAREILDKASKDIDTGLAKDPELQAKMINVMGDVYDNLGLYPRAESLLQHGVEIQRHVLGPDHPDTLQSMNSLAVVMAREGHYAAAEKSDRETLDVRRRVLGPGHPDTLNSMNNLAIVLVREGHYAEAEKLYRETLDVRRRTLGPEHRDTVISIDNLANLLWSEGRYAEAEKLHRETLDIRRRILGPGDPGTVNSMNNLANVLWREGNNTEAEQLYHEGLEIRRRVLGPEHPDTLISINNLANLMDHEGHFAEAEKLNRDALDIRRRVLGPEHPDTLVSMNGLAAALNDEGRYAEAEKLYRETLNIRRRVLGPEHPDTLRSMNDLVNVIQHEGRYTEAEKLNRETLDIRLRVLGPDHPDTAVSTYNLACVVAGEGRRNEAFTLLRQAIDHGLPIYVISGMDKDTDLQPLHGDPRFTALIAYAKQKAAAGSKK